MANLAALTPAPGVVIVTQDPAVAAHADRIVQLREGRIVRDERRRSGDADLTEPRYA